MRQKQSAAIGARGWNKVIHMVTCPLLSFQFYSRSVIICWHVSLSSEACLSCTFLSICLEYMWTLQFTSLFISLSLSTYSTYQSIYLSAYISIYENMFVCPSVCLLLYVHLSVSIYLSVFQPVPFHRTHSPRCPTAKSHSHPLHPLPAGHINPSYF